MQLLLSTERLITTGVVAMVDRYQKVKMHRSVLQLKVYTILTAPDLLPGPTILVVTATCVVQQARF